jgi:TetR/AcrR family transcriptional regulator, transcriptional repressor for nem operon
VKENEKKEDIIREGFAQMQRKGYNNTTIDEIINKLGIPKGSFYYYFESKESFTIVLLDQYRKKMMGEINLVLEDKSNSPVTRILGLYSGYIDSYINESVFGYGNFASKICQEVGEIYPSIKKAANEVFINLKQLHVKCLEEAKQCGEIRKETDTEKLAEWVIYAWEGAILRMKSSGNIRSLVVFREMLKDFLVKY